jgi:hypothetical protein
MDRLATPSRMRADTATDERVQALCVPNGADVGEAHCRQAAAQRLQAGSRRNPKPRLAAHAPQCARCRTPMKVRILILGRKVDDVACREVQIRGPAFSAACGVSLMPRSTLPGT